MAWSSSRRRTNTIVGRPVCTEMTGKRSYLGILGATGKAVTLAPKVSVAVADRVLTQCYKPLLVRVISWSAINVVKVGLDPIFLTHGASGASDKLNN